MAGARTVVCALWEISDQDAARFISQLYERSDQDLPFRIRELQLKQIESLRSRNRPDHPLSWAAFIVQGDWRTPVIQR